MEVKDGDVILSFMDYCSIFGGPVCTGNPDAEYRCIMFNSAKRHKALKTLIDTAFDLGKKEALRHEE